MLPLDYFLFLQIIFFLFINSLTYDQRGWCIYIRVSNTFFSFFKHCQKSSKIINLSKVVDGKYYGNIQKTPKNIKVSKIEKNNNNELVVGDEYNLNNDLEKVKQKLQNELETYVANNYSILLLESQSVKKKIAYLIEKYLEKYTYTNIH